MPSSRAEKITRLIAIIHIEQPGRLFMISINGGLLIRSHSEDYLTPVRFTSSHRLNAALSLLGTALKARQDCHLDGGVLPGTVSEQGLKVILQAASAISSVEFMRSKLIEFGVEEVRLNGLDASGSELIDEALNPDVVYA